MLWLLLIVCAPTLVLWMFNFDYLKNYKKTLFACILSALAFSIPWDYWAIRINIWKFPTETNVGFWFFGIPLEEYLFMMLVTFYISTITLVLKRKFGDVK